MDVESFADTECVAKTNEAIDVDLLDGFDEYINLLDKYGIKVPELLLPAEKVDLQSWAVIACDQYTQDRDYWERCRKNAG